MKRELLRHHSWHLNSLAGRRKITSQPGNSKLASPIADEKLLPLPTLVLLQWMNFCSKQPLPTFSFPLYKKMLSSFVLRHCLWFAIVWMSRIVIPLLLFWVNSFAALPPCQSPPCLWERLRRPSCCTCGVRSTHRRAWGCWGPGDALPQRSLLQALWPAARWAQLCTKDSRVGAACGNRDTSMPTWQVSYSR